MRILVVSDTHGDAYSLQQAVLAQPSARVVIHLGDGVRGNCDFRADDDLLYAREETIGGKRLFFTHGHLYQVKFDLYRAVTAAKERGADILLFGHTHQALTDYEDGLYMLNPGSLSHGGTYGLIDITPAGVVLNIVKSRV